MTSGNKELYVEFKNDGYRAKAILDMEDMALDYAFLRVEGVIERDAAPCVKTNEETQGGEELIFIGASENDPKWSYASGIVSTDVNKEWEFGMSSGCVWGDSGAGVFNSRTGALAGVVYAIGLVPSNKRGGRFRVSCKASVRHFHVIKLHIYHTVDPDRFSSLPFMEVCSSPFITSRVFESEESDLEDDEEELRAAALCVTMPELSNTTTSCNPPRRKGWFLKVMESGESAIEDDEELRVTTPDLSNPRKEQRSPDSSYEPDFTMRFPTTPPWLQTPKVLPATPELPGEELLRESAFRLSFPPTPPWVKTCSPEVGHAKAHEDGSCSYVPGHVCFESPSPSRFYPMWNINFIGKKSDMFAMDFLSDI